MLVPQTKGFGAEPQVVRVFRGDGTGRLINDTSSSFTLPVLLSHPRDAVVADFDGDGRQDAFVADHGLDLDPFPGGHSVLLLQNASGKLADASAGRIPNVQAFSHNVTAGDVDGDGDVDLYVANTYNQTLEPPWMLINDGSGTFIHEPSRLPAIVNTLWPKAFTASRFVDVDRDGDLDLVLGSVQAGADPRDTLLLNDGSGVFTIAPAAAMPLRPGDASWTTVYIEPADFNGDGAPDLLMATNSANYKTTRIQLALNRGDGTFEDRSELIPQVWPAPTNEDAWVKFLFATDVNRDGWMDFVVQPAGGAGLPARLYVNQGPSGFVDASGTLPAPQSGFRGVGAVAVGDFDKDGRDDIFLLYGGTQYVALNRRPYAIAPACGYSVDASSVQVAAQGDVLQLDVTTAQDCPWAPSPTATWITAQTGSRQGPGTVTVSVAPNVDESPRTGTITVGSVSVVVRQRATLDVDGDGLPNSWEQRYGLDPSRADAADGAAGDPDADGVTNLDEYRNATHPRGFFTRYFAEGATSTFFDTSLALLNLSSSATAGMLLRFQKGDGTNLSRDVSVGPLTRVTIAVEDLPGMEHAEFSTVVESDQEFVADRTMAWDAAAYGSHAETSLAAPSTTWYLAEGATHSGFDLFYLVQNPNEQGVNVHVKYLLPAGPPIERDYVVAARSRFNVWVNVDDPRLASTDVSAVITTDRPTIVERAMYLTPGGVPFGAGHESAGVTAPATEWFLAEGATGVFFDLFVLIANPNDTAAAVDATFLLPDGSSLVKSYMVAPNSRFNIWVDAEDPMLAETAVSTVIISTNGVPVIVERSMWWPGPTAAHWAEAHNSAGLTATGSQWALAEGEVGGPRSVETYILIANRGPDVVARVTLFYEDGTADSKAFALKASSRTNVTVAAEFPGSNDRRFGAIVEASDPGAQIAVERAMYSNANGVAWAAGTNAVATRLR